MSPDRLARHIGIALPFLLLLPAACTSPDPRAELEVDEIETHWAIDRPVGQTQYIAPVVRFRVRNKGGRTQRSVQATATFRRKGESQAWSGAFQQVSPPGGKALSAGESRLVVLKPEGEGRYSSTGPPESMLQHPLFKDVRVDVFLRVGSSGWIKFAEAEVERRIGPRTERAANP